MSYFKHPNALVETEAIGEGTRIWAFSHVLPGARIGTDCNICDGVFIENDVEIGDRVTVKCGVQLWDGVRLGDDVFIGPNATFTNDIFPRSRQYPGKFPLTHICKGASIGANATILPGLEIGEKAMVGAGSVVTKNVPAFAVVIGNPARVIGWSDPENLSRATERRLVSPDIMGVQSGISGVTIHRFDDGSFAENQKSGLDCLKYIPFKAAHCRLLSSDSQTGIFEQFALRNGQQAFVCASGTCSLLLDDGIARAEYALDNRRLVYCIGPLVWRTLYKLSADAIILVFESSDDLNAEMIVDYSEFIDFYREKSGS